MAIEMDKTSGGAENEIDTIKLDDPNERNKRRGKLKTKNSRDPSTITPEYIEEQRRLRNLRKLEKKRQDEKQGESQGKSLKPQNGGGGENRAGSFIQRPMLTLESSLTTSLACEEGLKVKIMTYNMLAQNLIRRSLFPTSGGALKWVNRSQALLDEIKFYDADIMCLQEVDFLQYDSFWKLELEKLGYQSRYHRSPIKNHGIAIVFKKELFEIRHTSFINHDREGLDHVKNIVETQNVGVLACLEFKATVSSRYPNLSRDGIIVGTTHLFWHPYGCFERARQSFICMKKTSEFVHTMNTLIGKKKRWYTLFGGDFNAQPFDTPYLSIAAKPIAYDERDVRLLARSLQHYDETIEVCEEGNDSKEKDLTDKDSNSVLVTPKDTMSIKALENLHNSCPQRAISLYSVGYKQVHPANSGLDNNRNEPTFSNWAHTWRGLLDYLFVVADWDVTQDFSQRVDSLDELLEICGIKLLKLLRLPTKEEMGAEPSGQPRLGQYPSDHLCLMAEVELV